MHRVTFLDKKCYAGTIITESYAVFNNSEYAFGQLDATLGVMSQDDSYTRLAVILCDKLLCSFDISTQLNLSLTLNDRERMISSVKITQDIIDCADPTSDTLSLHFKLNIVGIPRRLYILVTYNFVKDIVDVLVDDNTFNEFIDQDLISNVIKYACVEHRKELKSV